MDVVKELHDIGIVPVIAVDEAEQALPLCEALVRGGLSAAEITFRTAAGQKAIKLVAEKNPDVLVGAGTVVTLDQCKAAIEAGAKFIVSPGYYDDVVNYCIENNVPILPGCVNSSDCTKAVNAGLKVVKFFPAEPSGGVTFIKALAPVFGQLNFMPTGGINTQNLMDYLGYDRIHACGGSWMVKKDLINAGKWDVIENISKEAVQKMLGLNLAHIGINCENEEEAEKVAKTFCSLFGFEYKPGNTSIYSGPSIECNKKMGKGTKGHIAFATTDVDRAIYHLSKRGVEFDMDTYSADEKGHGKLVYLKGELGGFAVHLVKK